MCTKTLLYFELNDLKDEFRRKVILIIGNELKVKQSCMSLTKCFLMLVSLMRLNLLSMNEVSQLLGCDLGQSVEDFVSSHYFRYGDSDGTFERVRQALRGAVC